jgi:hypothetical protein
LKRVKSKESLKIAKSYLDSSLLWLKKSFSFLSFRPSHRVEKSLHNCPDNSPFIVKGSLRQGRDDTDADTKALAIHRSTKTTFKVLKPLHSYLRNRSRWYYNWHLNPHANRIHISAAALTSIIAGVLVFTLLFNSFTEPLRAQNFNKVWTTTADFNTGTNSNIDTSSDQAQLASSSSSFSEGFTNTANKDAASDANWDTVAHKLTLPGDPTSGVASDLQAKWKLAVGTSEDIKSSAYDSTNHFIYLGGSVGSFAAFKTADNTMVNLTSKISTDWSTNAINALTFDLTNGKIYLGGAGGKFGCFTGGSDPVNGTWVYLTAMISTDWATRAVYALTFDNTNGKVYLGGDYAKFGSFTGGADPANGTWVYLTAKILADWVSPNEIDSLTFDSTNGKIYLGGFPAKFGCFTGGSDPANGTWVYLTAKILADWTASNVVSALAFDSTNGKVYLVGGSSRFGTFTGGSDPANGIWVNLTAKIIGPLNTNPVNSLVFDLANNEMYLGSYGHFGAFPVSANPASGTFVDLTSKFLTDWSNLKNVKALSLDQANSKLYLSGDSGKFGTFTLGATPANGTWTYLAANVDAAFVGYDILASTTDTTNNIVYLGGASGKFAALKPDGTMVNLTTKISTNWSTSEIRAIAFDSTNSKIYLGGGGYNICKFGVFTGGSDPANGTWVYLTTKISADWSANEIFVLTFDSANGKIYLGGQGIKFGVFTGGSDPANGTWVYLTTKISGTWNSGDYVWSMTFDSTNGKIYIGSFFDSFGVFTGGSDPANGTWVDLSSKISTDWPSNNQIATLTFDSTNGVVYLGGASGKFGAFKGGATPASGTWTYLASKITADWSTNTVCSLAFVGGKIFLGGAAGKFGMVTALATPSNDVWTNLYAKTSGINGTSDIKTMTYAPSVATLCLGSVGGKFTTFLIGYSTNKNGISLAVDSTAQTICKATLTATASTPANTGITYYLSNNGGSTWNAVGSGGEYTFSTATSDLRWKANLTTTDPAVTPEITGIALSYKYFTSNTGTMDLVYDATQAVTPTLLSWTHSLPTNTAMTVKIRTASAQGGLAGAAWSDTKNAVDTPVNLKTINVGGVTGVLENQFSEVYITFSTTDGLDTPVLSDITEQYVINAAPELGSLTASQLTDGSKTVNISYNLKDSDSHQNPYNQDQVGIAYQYSTDSGSTWHDCSTVTNSGLLAVNSNNTWKNESAAWNVGTDLANSYYNNTVEVRVNANDNEQAHNTATLASAAFSVDTKNPVTGAISGGGVGIKINDGSSWTNNPTINLTLSTTDDSAKYMEVRNDTSFTGIKENYNATKAGWALSSGDGNKTVSVRFYDGFGNYTDANSNVLLDTTAPAMPAHFTIFDASDMQLGTYQIVVSWNEINNPNDFLTYSLERKTESTDWTELATFNNISSDVYSDKGLDNTKTYSYRLRSKDIHSNNSTYTDIKSMMPAGVDTIPPQITGDGASATARDTTATVTWVTDKPSDSYVEYGTTTDYGSIQGSDELVVNHTVNLVGLNPTTTYQFRIKSRDVSGNRAVSANSNFTTTLPTEAALGVSITGATAQKPGADPEEVTIIWTTDRYSTSQVYYGTDENNLDMKTPGDDSLNKTHYVAITHLNPNTKYYYKAYSKDTYGNEVWGESKYFVTAQSGLSTPTITSVKATDTTLSSTIISWQTTTVATSVVEIGTEAGTYSSHLEDKSLGSTTQHVVRATDLEQGKEYHFRVLGQGGDDRWVASDDYTFSTVPMPAISEVSVKGVASDIATITWKTNIDITSSVNYGVAKLDQSQGDTTAGKDHTIILKALKPATKYQFQIKAGDNYGNIANSGIESFQTIIDSTPPVIKDMKSEVSIITAADGASKAQAVVSWSTDEPATSQIRYAMGVAIGSEYPLSTTEDTNLTTSHVMIISDLQPSATYHLKLLSKDSSNNLATSDDYTVLTLNQDKSLLQYIIQILEDRFSWLKGFGLF